MDDLKKCSLWTFGCGCVLICIAGIIALIILLVDAANSVPVFHLGLDYNRYSGYVDLNKVYSQGLHWTGPGHDMILFPATQKNIDIRNFRVRSYDGIDVTLDTSFQYRITEEQLPNLFQQFGILYEIHLTEILKHTLRNVASKYVTTDFFDKREEIGLKMENETYIVFKEHFADLAAIQVKRMELPESYEMYIKQKTIAEQQLEKARNDQRVQKTQADTRLITAINDVQVQWLHHLGVEEGRRVGKIKEIDGLYTQTTTQTRAYETFASELGFTKDELLTYLWIQNIKHGNVSRKILNIDRPKDLWVVESTVKKN